MADQKISDLTAYATPLVADVLPIVDTANTTTKKITWANLFKSPTLITPVLGVATITSLNGLIITTTTGTLTIAGSKVLSISNTLTLAGTDSTVMTFPSTSATIARTDAANTFTGVQTMVAPILGTPTTLVGTNITGTATGLTSGISNALKSATTTVNVSVATAPTSGQVLTATASTTATWQTPATAPAYKNGGTTYDLSTASATQNIAHGLGVIPKSITLYGTKKATSINAPVVATLSYNGTNMSCIIWDYINGAERVNNGTWRFYGGANETEYATGVVTFDATNIIITWTKTSSPTGTLQLLWEAIA